MLIILCNGSFLKARDELAKIWFAFWLRIHLRCFQIKLETEMWLGRAAIVSVLSACASASQTEGCQDGKCEDDQLELLQFKAPNGSGSSGLKAKEKVTSFGFNFNPSFGGIVPGHPLYKHLEGSSLPSLPKDIMPKDFDARSAWPHCTAVISHIRDQSKCGSCWAVGSISTLNDRLCIMKGDNTTMLSADDPLANCNSTIPGSELPTCVHPIYGGCGGGQLEFVWKWYVESGAVNGANYQHLGFSGEKIDTCAPYPFPPCHDPNWAHSQACTPDSFQTPPHFTKCLEEYQPHYWQDKIKATSWYKVPSEAIQAEIKTRGPVSCQVMATCSMAYYTSGVYIPYGQVCGGHVMRIVGWGVENGTDYWWVANSWGKNWGDNGFIKWIRGINAAGIESGVVTGIL